MDDASVSLQRADDADVSSVESLLDASDLPSVDVRSKSECFYVAYDGDDPVAVAGVEQYGADGLLRSVAVEESVRGSGVGTAVCDAMEARARADGVETLYLLTTTAAGFFAGRGYEEVARDDAPDAVQRTTAFEEFCPASAVCMRKSL